MNIWIKNIKAVLLKDDAYTVEKTDIYISNHQIVSVGEAVDGL